MKMDVLKVVGEGGRLRIESVTEFERLVKGRE